MAAAYCFRPRGAGGFLLICAFLASAAGKQVAAAQPDGPSQAARYTITGTVINSATGSPLRRALVQVGDRMQLTDSQGHFEFGGMRGGTYGITAEKPGFFHQPPESSTSASFTVTTPSATDTFSPTEVEVGPGKPPVILKLVPEGVIAGLVSDENGDPMEGVAMRVRGWRVVNGRRQLLDFMGQSTDEDGRFRIFSLMPGVYYVFAEPAPGRAGILARQFSSGAEGYPTTYFPGVTQLSAATPITVSAGMSAHADFELHPRPLFQVAGYIAGFSGGRVNSAQIVERSDEGSVRPVNFNPLDGHFFVNGVATGSYSIQIMATDPAGHTLFGEAAVNVAGDSNGLVIPVSPGVSIPIIVQTEFGNSSGEDNATPVTVQLSPAVIRSRNFFRTALWSSLEGDNENRVLAVRSVPPGRYYVNVLPQSRGYAASLVSGSTDLFRELLTVGPGGQVAPIEVLLRNDASSLAVVVRSNGIATSAHVLAVRQDEPLRLPWVRQTNSQGEAVIDGLPPGDYVILAFDSISNLEYANPEALRDYISQGTRITLGSREAKNVSVELIRR